MRNKYFSRFFAKIVHFELENSNIEFKIEKSSFVVKYTGLKIIMVEKSANEYPVPDPDFFLLRMFEFKRELPVNKYKIF